MDAGKNRMKLHCLGTAGYHPNESRHTSCYAIPESNLVLDAGSGFFRVGKLLSSDTLHVMLTHAHLDHVFGLTFVMDFLATTSLKHIHVYAEAEKIAAIQQHLFHPLLFPVVPPFHWHALEDLGTKFRLEDTEVTWFPLEHPGGSVGYRLDWQSTSLAYVTDTTCSLNSGYWDVIQGVDWLIHECNFSDDYRELAIKTGHSWASEVLEAAYKHRIARLLLGHFNPLTDSSDPVGIDHATSRNLRKTPSQIMMATDGLTIDLERL